MPQRAAHLRSDISYLSLLGFYLLLLFLTYALFWGGFTKNLDNNLVHDGWVRLEQRAAPDDIVVVGVDYASLRRLGRWPWNRDLHAAFFKQLAALEVKAAAIDITYVEPDAFPANDQAMAESIGRLPIAALPVMTDYTDDGVKLPIPELLLPQVHLGHIFQTLDPDGISRRTVLKAGYKEPHWPALALTTYNAIYGELNEKDIPGNRIDSPTHQDISLVDVNELYWKLDYRVLIPFYGPAQTFTNISIHEIINGTVDPALLKDKIVFVGATATGLNDVLPTPVSSLDSPMPGVEIHANIFAALRDGSLVREVDYRLNFVIAAALLFLILLLYSRLSPLWCLVGAAVFSLVPIGISYFLYSVYNLWYPPLVATIPVLISYFLWSWHRLDFVSDFLRQETDKLEEVIGVVDNTDNVLLAKFFENAEKHLPLQSWSFSASGQEFAGGTADGQSLQRSDASFDIWSANDCVYQKRYATPGNLFISFKSEDKQFAEEFSGYIDSLSRVRERESPALLTGSIERLQVNTYRLSSQMENLRQLNGLSESIFEGSSAGHIVWNAAGEVVRVNDIAHTLMPGMLDKEVPLIEFLKLVGRDPDNRDHDRLQRLITRSEAWQINRIETDNELVINFHAVGETLTDRLISASIVDVTEIRRNERSRAELIDFLSHDLRSPLISSLYMLSDDLKVSDQGNDEKIERIENNINLSLTMMDDLLTIARADNLTAEQFTTVLFDAVIDNAVDQLVPQARNRNIRVEIDATDEELWVNADASLLERAFVNIVSNAIKYSPDETVVTVRYWLKGEKILLEVEDQGIGIAPEMMENLFQRFKRDAKISKQFKGIGLGLALVARVVTQHGGNVWASSPGNGTRISVELPIAFLAEETG